MIQKSVHRLLMTGFVAFISSLSLMAQHKVEMLAFGDMDQWVDRQIKESSIIGGNTKNVYAIGPTTVIKGDQVYAITNSGIKSHIIDVTFPVFSSWNTVINGSFKHISTDGTLIAYSDNTKVSYGNGQNFLTLSASFGK